MGWYIYICLCMFNGSNGCDSFVSWRKLIGSAMLVWVCVRCLYIYNDIYIYMSSRCIMCGIFPICTTTPANVGEIYHTQSIPVLYCASGSPMWNWRWSNEMFSVTHVPLEKLLLVRGRNGWLKILKMLILPIPLKNYRTVEENASPKPKLP